MTGHKEPLSRNAILWDDRGSWDMEMYEVYSSLIALRKAEPALRGLAYRTVTADGNAYAAERGEGDDRLFVIANAGTEEATVDLGTTASRVLWGQADLDGSTARVPARSGAVVGL